MLAAVQTANALRPAARRRTLLSVPAFLAGWPVSELPWHTLAWQSAGMGLAVESDLRRRRETSPALLGLALLGASALGLWRLARAAGGAEAVLADAIGGGHSDDLAEAAEESLARRPQVVRTMRIRRSYAHDADMAYGPHGRANQLDVWRSPAAERRSPAPVLVQVPGGAWITGSKEIQAYPLMSHLADRGWLCVPINYRLGPRSHWPAQIVDVKRAIAWVKENIAQYGGDPSFIAITGGSAGGHLSALAALTANDAAFQPEFEHVDTAVQAAVPFYGAYDWVDESRLGHRGLAGHLERMVVGQPLTDNWQIYRDASPTWRVGADAPPFFVLHGRNDSLIPVEQGRAFVAALRGVSRRSVHYAELPYAQHAFDLFGSVRAAATAEAVARFLERELRRRLRSV